MKLPTYDIYWYHGLRLFASDFPEDWSECLERLGEGVIEEALVIWQPFENLPAEDVFDLIEEESNYLRNNFIPKENA